MPPEENPQTPSQSPSSVHNIRTFQSDVEDAIKEGGGSLSKIAIAENDRRIKNGFTLDEPEKPERTRFIVELSVGLITVGLIALGFLYFFRTAEQKPVPLIEPEPQIIATDKEKNLNVAGFGRDQMVSILKKSVSEENVTLSSILSLRLVDGAGETAKPITTKVFLDRINASAPNELVRSLSDSFLFGIHAQNVNEPFLILKTGYYQNAFAGMLAWESTLEDDLGAIFIPPSPTEYASTTDQILDRNNSFVDILVKNRDTRALKNSEGQIVFLYSFPDKNTIVITTNADTLQKITDRLFAERLVQ